MAGTIKAGQIQLGDNADATQNFVWQTNNDGSAKLARGNVGATTQDIMTVDAAGQVAFPQSSLRTTETLWTGALGIVGEVATLSRSLVAGDEVWLLHGDVSATLTSALILVPAKIANGALIVWGFGANGLSALTFNGTNQLTGQSLTSGYTVVAIYARKP